MIWKKLLSKFTELGVAETDSDEMRLNKNMVLASYVISASAASLWGVLYLFQGEVIAGAFFLGAVTLATLFLIDFIRTRKIDRFRFVMFTVYLLIPAAVSWLLGGFYQASLIMIWSLLSPILALMTSTIKNASRWIVAYLALFVGIASVQHLLPNTTAIPDGLNTIFMVLNLTLTSIIVFGVIYYFIAQKNSAYALLAIEEEKSNTLLLNVLPKEIANILKDNNQTIANHFESASILFADLVGFTPMSATMEPVAMVELLNEVFTKFDELTDKYGLEKIRTIGDNYMVAAGVPTPRNDHAQALAELGLDICEYVITYSDERKAPINFRIGINSGPMIAGVIGKKKFQYDVWGDTVNIASRMESHGVASKIQVTSATYALLKNEYAFERRGMLEIKGKGEMETWFLLGRK